MERITKVTLLVTALTALILMFSASPTEAQSLILEEHGLVTDSRVYDIIIDGDDVYLGGNFTTIGTFVQGYGLIHDASTGALENGWPEVEADYVKSVIPDGSGGWYIAGLFGEVGGYERFGLAHILANKTVDPNWNPTSDDDGYIFSLADGGTHLYVAGYFEELDGQTMSHLARIDKATGALDPNWNPSPNSAVSCIALSGSDLYVSGSFTSIGGQSRNKLAKLNDTTGTADPTWDPNPNSTVNTLAVSGSDIYTGGWFTSIGGQSRNRIAKLNNTTGAADATWNPNSNSGVYAITISDSNIYAGGYFTSIGGQSRNRVAKLNNTTGDADVTWNPNANGSVMTVTVSGSNIYVGGSFTSIGGQSRRSTAKLNNSTGAADPAWNADIYGTPATIAVYGDDIYLGGGMYVMENAATRNYAAKVSLSTNDIDSSWNPNLNNSVEDLEMVGDDIYIAGYFTSVGGTGRNRLAKLDKSTGAVDATWNPSANDPVHIIAASGNKLYVGGEFTSIGGTSRNYIAQLNDTTGAVDATWNPSADNWVEEIFVSDSYIYVGGYFDTIGGETRKRIAKLNNTTGAAVAGWDASVDEPSAYMWIEDITELGDYIYAGGFFESIGGETLNGTARIHKDTGIVDNGWDPSTYNSSTHVTYGYIDAMIIGGQFYEVHETPTNIAKLDPATAELDPFWLPDKVFSPPFVSAFEMSGSHIWIAMEWYDKPRPYLCQYTIESTPSVIIMDPVSVPINDTTPSLGGTATDARSAISTVEYQIDSTSGTWRACIPDDGTYDEKSESFTCTPNSSLSEGSHTIYVRSTDSVDNSNTSDNYGTLMFTVDTTPPSFPIVTVGGLVNVIPGSSVSVDVLRPTFVGITEPYAHISIAIYSNTIFCEADADGNGNWQCTPEEDIPAGRHRVVLSTTDLAGNTYEGEFTLLVGLADTGTGTQFTSLFGVMLLAAVAVLIRQRSQHRWYNDYPVPRVPKDL